MPPAARHQRKAATGSRGSCLTREKRSSSAAATMRPSRSRQQADSWKNAETPTTFIAILLAHLPRPCGESHPEVNQQPWSRFDALIYPSKGNQPEMEIGRASCRERV